MALAHRRPEGVNHSDQASYDNAMAENFFATLECELIERCVFRSRPRRGGRSSSSSRAGTTRRGDIPRSDIARR